MGKTDHSLRCLSCTGACHAIWLLASYAHLIASPCILHHVPLIANREAVCLQCVSYLRAYILSKPYPQ